MLYYVIFRTPWGYAGLAGTGKTLCRTCLPVPERRAVEQVLLKGLKPSNGDVWRDEAYLHDLQQRIVAYFEGERVDFTHDPAVDLAQIGPFRQKVLWACRNIGFGRTTTYSDLARRVGSVNAARAVGGAMAANPFPLIIPCHRVLRTDGGLGGFSAIGGTDIKQRMLRHEQSADSAKTRNSEA
ncbi:MAG: hypothetical protein A2Y77_17790 [Planctomycetes bacterium RBG_13_62_9]|nr:MAG: hypothetical protein A2Y77_17790 [Planctomycetes bacterium RBG_13_62_9]